MRFETLVNLLPHGPSMTFIRDVRSLNLRSKRIEARSFFDAKDSQITDHFPNFSIVPGIFLIEAMAQAGLILFQASIRLVQEREIPVLTHIDVRFLRPVFPNNNVMIIAHITKSSNNGALFETFVKYKGHRAVEARMTFGIKVKRLLK